MKKIILFLFAFASLITAQKATKTIAKADIEKVASTVQNTNATTSYDFTTGSDKYYGTNGAKEIQSGVWGMIAGDANASGIITNSDKDPINTDLNSSGYYDSDVNMSGIVTNSDKDLINTNVNKSSQVP